MFSQHNHDVSHSTKWDDPPEDYGCRSYWEFKGVKFPCDLGGDHSGPHVSYPKKKEDDAVIIWTEGADKVVQ